jgi:hypothetical protein
MPHSFLSHLASFCEPDGSEHLEFSRDVITFYMGGKFDLCHERLVQTTGRAVELQTYTATCSRLPSSMTSRKK